jgi:hypothetical protein
MLLSERARGMLAAATAAAGPLLARRNCRGMSGLILA